MMDDNKLPKVTVVTDPRPALQDGDTLKLERSHNANPAFFTVSGRPVLLDVRDRSGKLRCLNADDLRALADALEGK